MEKRQLQNNELVSISKVGFLCNFNGPHYFDIFMAGIRKK